jgi:hypothetical protein
MSPHPHHDQLAGLAREYLTRQWATEAQILHYLDRHCTLACAPITPSHVRTVMLALAVRGEAEGGSWPGDHVVHWRRRTREGA